MLLFFFSCGLGLLLSALAVYFRDMMHLYSILTMGWMYATPLFYPITALPETLQKLMKLNPLYHYINLFRNLMMYGNIPGPNTWIACIFVPLPLWLLACWCSANCKRTLSCISDVR